MPTYEYKCSACGHRFEEFQAISAKPIRKCPQCGKAAVNRLISAGAGIIFRGSGFYETDYRSDNYKTSAKKESEAGKASVPAEAKSDGKPKSDVAADQPATPAVAAAPATAPAPKPTGRRVQK